MQVLPFYDNPDFKESKNKNKTKKTQQSQAASEQHTNREHCLKPTTCACDL